jgi:F-type H+-transporting ATPase subunit gamma
MTRAALYAFVAENEARMAAMAAASRQIEMELGDLEALTRRERQEAITAEIIEIASGAMART